MVNRAPGTVWSLHRDFERGYVRTAENDEILIALPIPGRAGWLNEHYVSRHEARMLAKRINQCLDGTRKR